MRTISKLVPLLLFGAVSGIQACGSTTYETQEQPNGNLYPVKGVIRGNVVYSGPPPCTRAGHVVGNAVVLVFDRRNPPPPSGLANTAVNFVAVPGDKLFANWPRTPDDVLRCPDPSTTTTASASYAIAPMDPGSYVIQAFYDYTGNFLPTFKFRNLPEATDVGGGYIDLNDAQSLVPSGAPQTLADGGTIYPVQPKQADPNYMPVFLPVDIGIPGAVPQGSKRGVPTFTMPSNGYVADNVTITMGARLPLARPYFWPQGVKLPVGFDNPDVGTYGSSAEAPPGTPQNGLPGDDQPAYTPVMTFPASLQLYAQPGSAGVGNPDVVNQFQAKFPQVKLNFGVPAPEKSVATDRTSIQNPFHFQLDRDPIQNGNGGIFVWWDGNHSDPLLNFVPEGSVPKLWPLIVLAKLKDYRDANGNVIPPSASPDPQMLNAQGADLKEPVVIIQGVTISEDSLYWTAQFKRCVEKDPSNPVNCNALSAPGGPSSRQTFPLKTAPDATNLQDHVTVLVRPSALCLDPRHIDKGGLLVTPHLTGPFPPADKADVPTNPDGTAPLFHPDAVISNPQLAALVNNYRQACIPPGRYAINMVYPTGQAWTTPNEAGHCASLEGDTQFSSDGSPGNCTLKPRPVLTSQGTRAYIEVLDDPAYCQGDKAVPPECTTLP